MKEGTKSVLKDLSRGVLSVLFWLVLMVVCEYSRMVNHVPMTLEGIVVYSIMGFMAVVTTWLCLWIVGFIAWCEKHSNLTAIPLYFVPLFCLGFLLYWYGSQLPTHTDVASLSGSHYPISEQYAYMQTEMYQKYGGCMK